MGEPAVMLAVAFAAMGAIMVFLFASIVFLTTEGGI